MFSRGTCFISVLITDSGRTVPSVKVKSRVHGLEHCSESVSLDDHSIWQTGCRPMCMKDRLCLLIQKNPRVCNPDHSAQSVSALILWPVEIGSIRRLHGMIGRDTCALSAAH